MNRRDSARKFSRLQRSPSPLPPVQFSLTPLAETASGSRFLKISLADGRAADKARRNCRRQALIRALITGLGPVAMNLRRQKLAAAVLRTAIPLLLAMTAALTSASQSAWAGGDATSGLPVPRFVSLKADRVTVRGGPDKDHDVSWIYTRVGWPVEITAEFENWRRIRDADGSEGWVYHSLLSGKRTGAVQMKSKADLAPVHANPDDQSPVTAQLQVGVLGTVKRCTGAWCEISGEGFNGWIAQNELWGVYPNEKFE
jgi:SH3-like domain-containing protein